MFSNKLTIIIKTTSEMAKKCNLKEFPLEMVIQNILEDMDVKDFFNEKNISVDSIQKELTESIQSYIAENQQSIKQDEVEGDIFYSNVVSRASLDMKIASSSKKNMEIDVYNILAATLITDNTEASVILRDLGVRREMFLEKLEKLQEDNYDDYPDDFSGAYDEMGEEEEKVQKGILINLNEEVKRGRISSLIGREDEINRMSTILARKTKNNPIITGDPGVGKTAIIEGLAYKIVNNDIVDELKDKEIYSLNMGLLLSGTKYRGDFEKRIQSVIAEMKDPKKILFIDEIHTILGAGASGGQVDMANLLKPSLTSGEFTVIGATTNEEYIKIFEKNGALARRFNEIQVKELDLEETITLLHGIKDDFAKHHKVSYQDGVLEEIAHLSDRYINNKHFPDKAIDMLDEVSAIVSINRKEDKVVNKIDVFALVSRIVGVPVDAMQDNETNKAILDLESAISQKVFGQDLAIKKVSEAMMLSYAGIKKESKPLGSFLCIGPSGVGKTELAKALATTLNMHVARFDMSEYMDSTSSKKLLGSDPGYIGFEEGGELFNQMHNNPYSVVLFDEFEKAHDSIQNIFLQILDEGSIKDGQGRMIDFKNSIIIFTSNAGVVTENQALHGMGFGAVHKETDINMEEIKKRFRPEFRNRLSSILEFNPLTKTSTSLIANKAISEVYDLLLKNKGISMKWSEAVSDFIGQEGFDPTMGARPIERKVEELISKETAKLILTKGLTEGSKITISLMKAKKEGDKPKLKFITKK